MRRPRGKAETAAIPAVLRGFPTRPCGMPRPATASRIAVTVHWRRPLAECRVTTVRAVPAFDAAKQHQARVRVRCKAKLRQTFARQRGEETLGHGMIVRVAAGVHGVTRANATLRYERRAQRRIQKHTGQSRHFGTVCALFPRLHVPTSAHHAWRTRTCPTHQLEV